MSTNFQLSLSGIRLIQSFWKLKLSFESMRIIFASYANLRGEIFRGDSEKWTEILLRIKPNWPYGVLQYWLVQFLP